MVSHERLAAQFEFILEIDNLKNTFRRNLILHGERYENSAEHSWSLALMAVLMAEHAAVKVDVVHVVKMVLIHDIVEIDAGDTNCYDVEANADKVAREEKAAERIFGMLPSDQRDMVRELWDEFEARVTPEARFANAIDRILPLLQNFQARGKPWIKNDIRVDQVRERMAPVREGSAILADAVAEIIQQALDRGYYLPAQAPAD